MHVHPFPDSHATLAAVRPRCSVFIAMSVDGAIARPDGALDWLATVERAGEDYGYAEFFASVDALVVGRKTWETVAAFPDWPWTGKRVVVLTSSTSAPAFRHGEERHAGDPAPLLESLAREGVRRVYVDGGETIRRFLAADLVDDLTISLVPILLPAGRRLFADGLLERRLRLVESRAFDSGLVRLRWEFATKGAS